MLKTLSDSATTLKQAGYLATDLEEAGFSIIELKEAGYMLCLATSKPHSYARKITAYFGISNFILSIFSFIILAAGFINEQ